MSLLFPKNLQNGQCVTIPLDVKQSEKFPPLVTCAPVAALEVTDDRATICRGVTPEGTDMYSVHFKSELGGPFGAGVSSRYHDVHNDTSLIGSLLKPLNLALAKLSEPEAYSRFMFELTPNDIALGRRKSPKTQATELYAVDNLDRATLVAASAFACWGYYAEDKALIQFAKTLHDTKMGIPGAPVFARDGIDQQKGNDLPARDFAALNAQPHYEAVPVVFGRASVDAGYPTLPTLFASKTVRVDVKANDTFAANVNFAPINAKQVTNDEVLLWTRGDELCARFKSEVGGPLGGFALAQHSEQFSPYALCVNSARQVYARRISDNLQFKVDMPDRAVLMVASALGALGFAEGNFYLKHVAEDLYGARGTMTTAGEALPKQDQLANQTKDRDYAAENLQLSMELHRQQNVACAKSFWSLGCLTPVSAGD